MIKFYNLLLFVLLAAGAIGQTTITVTDADLENGTYNWTSDHVYVLDGYVFLEEGGRLNIEAGTVIKGKADPSNTDITSALIVTRGAQIFAEGTRDAPIIFTAEDDDLSDPDDLGPEDRGEWGGLILLGRATISDDVCAAEIEGVKAVDNDPRVRYGDENCNFDDTDNSGVLRFVSVRHGGSILEDGDEINGITLGAVGSGTTIEYVEVYANDDDGIEWFGGTVDVRFAAVAFCADDTYDWDDGFRGRGQFWFSIQGLDDGGNGGEHDGAHPDDNDPPSDPTVYNVTYIGMGANNTNDPDAEYALLMRDGTAGDYANSIFTEFPFHAIEVEDRAASNGLDSRQRLEAGDLTLRNNIWWDFGSGSELVGATNTNSIVGATGDAEDPDAMFLVNHLANNGNSLVDPQLNSISRTTDNGLDPRPSAGSPAVGGANADFINNDDDFFVNVRYKGAFCSMGSWLNGWTALSANNHLDNNVPWADHLTCDLMTDVEDIYQSDDLVTIGDVRPNPAIDMTSLKLDLQRASDVRVEIFNALGAQVRMVFNGKLSNGEHTIDMDVSSLNAGSYTTVVRVDGRAYSIKLIVQ